MEHRTPEELPNEHVLLYSAELAGDFLQITEHIFNCILPSSETSGREFVIIEDIDTSS